MALPITYTFRVNVAPRIRQHVLPAAPKKKIAIPFAVVVAAVWDGVYTSTRSPFGHRDAASIPSVQSSLQYEENSRIKPIVPEMSKYDKQLPRSNIPLIKSVMAEGRCSTTMEKESRLLGKLSVGGGGHEKKKIDIESFRIAIDSVQHFDPRAPCWRGGQGEF